MKYAVLSFLFWFSSIHFAFSQERTSLIIQKNTEVSLGSLLFPILDSKTGTETVYMSQLYLGEGAKLYINRPITIDVKRIILKPKSTIHTLGNSLTIKTEVFDVLNFEPPGLNLSEDQRTELMGRIDTRHKEEKHNGKDGEPIRSVADRGKNAESRDGEAPLGYYPLGVVFDNAQIGLQGEAGGGGQAGKKGGDATLYVKKFMGGYFDTRGGNGGRGGKGGSGGNGGCGLSFPNNGADFESAIWNNVSQYQFFCDGARGGEGGRGGNGGNGGDGGNISIVFYEEDLSSEKTLLILRQGGKSGEGGTGGEGGEGGALGSVPVGRMGRPGVRRYVDPQSGNQISYWFDGKPGPQGASGERGDRGADGAQGVRSVKKYDSQN